MTISDWNLVSRLQVVKTNCPWVYLILATSAQYLNNWLILFIRWKASIRHTCIELCVSHSLFFTVSFFFSLFSWLLLCGCRCQLYYTSFVPIEFKSLRQSQRLQQSDVFLSFQSIHLFLPWSQPCAKLPDNHSVPFSHQADAIKIASTVWVLSPSIVKHPFTMGWWGPGNHGSFPQFLLLHQHDATLRAVIGFCKWTYGKHFLREKWKQCC